MNREQLIAHTRDYMDMLSRGIDPISRAPVGDDSIASQPRLMKCFAFVSELLDELIENRGFVALTPEAAQRGRVVISKAAFAITPEQRGRIGLSQEPVPAAAFLKAVNRFVDPDNMEKLSIKSVNAWLLAQGLVTEEKEPSVINRTVRRPTQRAEAMGITEQEITDAKTGEIKRQLMLSQQAQEYMLSHIDDISGIT